MLAVLAALGVPPSLYTSQGAALRESYRHLFGSTIEPLAQLIAAELSEKLEEEVTIGSRSGYAAMSVRSRGASRASWNRGSRLSRCTRCSASPAMPRSRRLNLSPSPHPYLMPAQVPPGQQPARHLRPLVATERTGGQLWYSRETYRRR